MLLKQCSNTVAWCRYVVTVLAWTVEAQWQSKAEKRIYRSAGLTAEVLWSDLHPVWFYKEGKDLLTLCLTKWSFFLGPYLSKLMLRKSREPFSDTCITPGGNSFAQCTRQLILSMSSALGGRMKQRFDLIGYEKVSHLDPVGKEEGYRGKHLAHARTDAQSFDLSVWLSSFPESLGIATSMGVQNKHTLIGQLITGMNARGRTIRRPHDCTLLTGFYSHCVCVFVRLHVDVCTHTNESRCWARGNVGQHILWALHGLAIVGQSRAFKHTCAGSQLSQQTALAQCKDAVRIQPVSSTVAFSWLWATLTEHVWKEFTRLLVVPHLTVVTVFLVIKTNILV